MIEICKRDPPRCKGLSMIVLTLVSVKFKVFASSFLLLSLSLSLSPSLSLSFSLSLSVCLSPCLSSLVSFFFIPSLIPSFIYSFIHSIIILCFFLCFFHYTRACFKKKSPLHIWAKNFRTTFFRNFQFLPVPT